MVAKQLIFVYNTNSGMGNALLDTAHKLFKPNTYNCNLCALTFGLLSEHKDWKKFRLKANIPMQFLHKDEYETQYKSKFGQKYNYPIILIQSHYDLDVFMNAEIINEIENVDSLISKIQKRLDIIY